VLLVRHPDTYRAERRYVLEVVLGEFLGLRFEARAEERADTEITVPELGGGRRVKIVEDLFATPEDRWLAPDSLPRRPLERWRVDPGTIDATLIAPELPVIYGRRLSSGAFYEQVEEEARLGVDIFGAIFFQLTRYEEIADPSKDEHDRFPADASLALAEGFLERPLANEYLEILWATLRRLWPTLTRTERVFRERLSHDVDWPLHSPTSVARTGKAVIRELASGHDRGLALAELRAAWARMREDPAGDPYNTFDLIMDLSERKGIASAFYFMSGQTDASRDGIYRLEEPWIGALIGRIHERGHEVGLHPSYGTFRDPQAIEAEFRALRRTCESLGVSQPSWGGRQHYLRFENPTTWRGWEQAGLDYDSTLGFPRDPGFRCGVCYEYPVFDLRARRRLRLRERPLVAMEITLTERRSLSDQAVLEEIERLRRRCSAFGGEFTLLWHNSRLASRRERDLYAATLAQA
jgi:hypothetical protein